MNLGEIQHLLPRSARTLIAVIGLNAATQLISKMPGVPFPVPKRRNRVGEARYEELAECIGHDAADALCRHFGGEVLEIPRCKKAINELRYRQIRAEFDEVTRKHSAAFAISKLAVKHQLTGRHIRQIVNMPDADAAPGVQLPLL